MFQGWQHTYDSQSPFYVVKKKKSLALRNSATAVSEITEWFEGTLDEY